MQIFYSPDIALGIFMLNIEESKHCVRVLRKRIGDEIHLTDGVGNLYIAEITDDNISACSLNVHTIKPEYEKLPYRLHLAVSPTKNADRIEWFVEKATEIGISEITFLECDHSEREKINIDRIEKIAVSAMKQSLKAYLPKINPLISFKKFLSERNSDDLLFIAHCDSCFDRVPLKMVLSEPDSRDIVVMIGPEGDFSKAEIESALKSGVVGVSLGDSRLRTETAALYSVAIVSLSK